MGLYASFDFEEAGFPEVVSGIVEGDGFYEEFEVEVDYSEACDAFVSTFLSTATQLVPVDTGYLQSTIDADADGWSCWASADAEYAQYVEYGTWKMSAQPYFTPALKDACQVFHSLAKQAVQEAQAELRFEMEAFRDEMGEEGGGGGFGRGGFGGILSTMALLVLLFPVLLTAYGIGKTIKDALMGDNKDRGSFGGFMPEVIIT